MRTGYKEEDGIKLPIFKNVKVEEDFVKVFKNMESSITRLNKIEILLSMYLTKTMSKEGLIFNNKMVRLQFINHVKELSKGEIDYRHQSIHNAFAVLKIEGIIIPETESGMLGSFFINPAFMYKGDRATRNRAITKLEKNGTLD